MPDTAPARLFAQGRRIPNHPAYYIRRESWVPTDFRTYTTQVKDAARALIAMGVQPGQVVCILSGNRPEWAIVHLAAMAIGALPSGIYPTNPADSVQKLVDRVRAPVVFAEDANQAAKVSADARKHLKHLVMFDGKEHLPWTGFMGLAGGASDTDVTQRMSQLKEDDPAMLIFTSGTTGDPKGVQLSHKNLLWTADTAAKLVGLRESDCSLSYLPLSHIAEQMFSLYAPISVGYAIYYAENMEKVPANLGEVRPTVFFGVPRVWEKMYNRINAGLEAAPAVRRMLANWAIGVGKRATEIMNDGGEPTGWLGFQYRLADRLVYSKARGRVGLDRARLLCSGAAPLSSEVISFLAGLGLRIHEIYGQSEASGASTFNRPEGTKWGTVGTAIPGQEVKLSPDGELLLKGDNVFVGYFEDDVATAKTFEDGWLKTGDIATIDARGFVTITGREKDIIITAGGKNIAPAPMQKAFELHPFIGQACVVGDKRPYPVALLTLDPDTAAEEAARLGISVQELPTHPTFVASLESHRERVVNAGKSRVAQVKRFHVLPNQWTVESGEVTPTMKIRRAQIMKNYADVIDKVYG